MAYERQNWVNGETVATAERMNHIEDGIENAGKNLSVFAQMFANGSVVLPNGSDVTIENWATTGNISVGGFECAPTSNRINIPANSCEYIEILGYVGGYRNTTYYLELFDENDALIGENRMLVQAGGNSYYATSLGNKIIKIPDKTKSYYIKLNASGYQTEATFNTGFGDNFSYIGVKKVG